MWLAVLAAEHAARAMARAVAARKLAALGGEPRLRVKDGRPVVTDNGCNIIDMVGLQIANPVEMEQQINSIVGVVTNGLFAQRGANVCLLGTPEGVKTIKY